MMYRLVKKYYDMGLYDDATVDLFVKTGDITQEQADTIKGSK